MFDPDKAREFYVDWLGFKVAIEHRFGPDMPLYLGLTRDGLELHLTEHHGDTIPGTRVRIRVDDVNAPFDELSSRPYGALNPGRPCKQPWGERELALTDPFGNRLTFYQPEN